MSLYKAPLSVILVILQIFFFHLPSLVLLPFSSDNGLESGEPFGLFLDFDLLSPSLNLALHPAMASARDIRPRQDDMGAHAHLSTSPSASFHSPSSPGFALTRSIPVRNAKHLKPFATEDIKVLLLENVNQIGRDMLQQQGYQVEFLKSSLPEDQLIEKIRWASFQISKQAQTNRTCR